MLDKQDQMRTHLAGIKYVSAHRLHVQILEVLDSKILTEKLLYGYSNSLLQRKGDILVFSNRRVSKAVMNLRLNGPEPTMS